MSMERATALMDAIQSAWRSVEAPAEEDMDYFISGWGKNDASLFLHVKPVEIDRDNEKFLVADVLAEMSPAATAAFLGPYLMAFVEDLGFQASEGYFSEPMVRGGVISLLTSPRTYTDVVRPHLDAGCKQAVLDFLTYALDHAGLLKLETKQIDALKKLGRSIRRDLNSA